MRRLLLPLLVLSLAPFASVAGAGCDPETGECHAVDCLAWNPTQVPTADQLLGEPEATVRDWLLPPVCPS